MRYRLKLRSFLFLLAILIFIFSLFTNHAYSNVLDKVCRSSQYVIESFSKKTDGLVELGSACYGFGKDLRIRISAVIEARHEASVKGVAHITNTRKSFCESKELYKIVKEIPIVWFYYKVDGSFYSKFDLNEEMCQTFQLTD